MVPTMNDILEPHSPIPQTVEAYLSARASTAVKVLWSRLDATERKERTAVPLYARQLKLYGKERADEWLYEKFGERSKELLILKSFQKQIDTYK